MTFVGLQRLIKNNPEADWARIAVIIDEFDSLLFDDLC
jgi:hypothetical protein